MFERFAAVTLIITFSLVINLALHFAGNDTVYWTDMGLNRISRAKRDQTWREDIITTGISRVEGIAVDWIAGKYHASPHLESSTVCLVLFTGTSHLLCSASSYSIKYIL